MNKSIPLLHIATPQGVNNKPDKAGGMQQTNLTGMQEYRAIDSHVLVVALRGAIGDWAAYVGAVQGKSFADESAEIAAKGTKLDRKVAEFYFPSWKHLEWRY